MGTTRNHEGTLRIDIETMRRQLLVKALALEGQAMRLEADAQDFRIRSLSDDPCEGCTGDCSECGINSPRSAGEVQDD
jgi:hypothetical protein